MGAKMKTEKLDVRKILYLDSEIKRLPGEYDPAGFCRLGNNRFLELICEGTRLHFLGFAIADYNYDYTSSNPKLEEWIKKLTETENIDYVIIGNNMGGGIPKAASVNPLFRGNKACIVWNALFPVEVLQIDDNSISSLYHTQESEKEAYRKLGYKHFLQRRDLAEHLLEYFGWK